MQSDKSLTKARLLCLRRTRVLQDMDTREIDPRELVDFIDGPSSQDQTWNWLKDNGYVTNGRGLTVRLTKKGETALNRACAR